MMGDHLSPRLILWLWPERLPTSQLATGLTVAKSNGWARHSLGLGQLTNHLPIEQCR
jgi:hypothetical protein